MRPGIFTPGTLSAGFPVGLFFQGENGGGDPGGHPQRFFNAADPHIFGQRR